MIQQAVIMCHFCTDVRKNGFYATCCVPVGLSVGHVSDVTLSIQLDALYPAISVAMTCNAVVHTNYIKIRCPSGCPSHIKFIKLSTHVVSARLCLV